MLYTNETDKLLIVFKDNTKKIIDNVEAYGLLPDHKFFHFNTDIRNFIPVESVLYFGSMNAWKDDQNEKNQDDVINKLREYIDRLENTKEYFNTYLDPGADIKINILNNIITDLKNDVLGERE